MKSLFTPYFLLAILFLSCGADATDTEQEQENASIVTLYTHRHYDVDQQIFDAFQAETGIEVQIVKASADELIQKLETEGAQSPADLLITVDAGRLVRAQNKGLLQAVESETLQDNIPVHLRANDNSWFGLTKRARVIVYHPDRVSPSELSTYEALTAPEWDQRILIRSSGNIYNQSLMASIIAHAGKEQALAWAQGMVSNFARSPKGNDRDQVKAIAADEGDLAIINTYYLGILLNSADPTEAAAGEAVRIFFPNQDDRGTHINVSGVGLAKHAPNRKNAIQLIEYLSSKEVQEQFAQANFEYPVNPQANSSELLLSWGEFKEDQLPLHQLGELNRDAVVLFDQAGWQ